MIRRVAIGWLLGTGWMVVTTAEAEPYLAMREGVTCVTCHANRTGGGMRNAFGANYGRTVLPWRQIEGAEMMDGNLGSRVRIGANLRGAYRGSLPDDGPFVGAFETSAATVYLDVEIIQGLLDIYVDQQVAPGGALNREAFALIRSRRSPTYLKAGKFFLPFGWRLQDDEAPIRRFSGFNFGATDTGIEAGFEPGRWEFAIAATNGSGGSAESDNGKQGSFRGGHVGERWRLGASASHNDGPGPVASSLAGIYAGIKAGPVVFLGEWDRIRNDDSDNLSTDGEVAHLEADWMPHQGINIRGWWGRFDADREAGGDDRRQFGLGVDWTPIPGLQVRGYFRERKGPLALAGSNDDEAVVELHLFF